MSKGSTQVKSPDPFKIAEADVLFNRINQFTPLNSLQYFGPERNTAVETLNPMLQENENRRLMSDRMLMDMALGRQGDMKGGSLPSLVPGLTLGDSGYGPTDPASNVPYVPDFIGGFQGQPQSMGQGNPKGGAQPQAPAPAQPAKGGMPQMPQGGQAKGGAAPQAPQGGGYNVQNAAQASQGTGGPSVSQQRDLEAWQQKWGGSGMSDTQKAIGLGLSGSVSNAMGLNKLFGDKEPKRGSLPGTEWQRNAQGKIESPDGQGHWNPMLGQWVNRRGSPMPNQKAPPGGDQQSQPPGGFGEQIDTQGKGGFDPNMDLGGGRTPQNGGVMGPKGGVQGAMGQLAGQQQMQNAPQGAKGGAQNALNTGQPMPGGGFMGGFDPNMDLGGGRTPSTGGPMGPTPIPQQQQSPQQSMQDMQMGIQGGLEQSVFDRNYGLVSDKFDQQQQRLYQDLANRGIARDSEAGQRELGGMAQARNNMIAGMSQDAVQQGIQAQLQNANMISANRATQFNELASLLGLNQVAQPGLQNFFAPANADVTGAFALNQQANMNNANNAQAQKSGMMDAVSNLGGSAMMASDRRVKRDIKHIGDAFNQKWYEFKYIWDDVKRIGVMSDEVPAEMVFKHPSGYDMVDYNMVISNG